MTEYFEQLEPTEEALRKGIHSLCQGDRGRLLSPPDRLKGTGPVWAGDRDLTRVVSPDDQRSVLRRAPSRAPANEDVKDRARQEVS